MRFQLAPIVLVVITTTIPASAQSRQREEPAPMATRFLDPINGLTLDQAIAQAMRQEPSLRAARSDIDSARGLSLQAGLRPNPIVSFTQQTEPSGTDAETRVEVQWPLDLFRKTGRVNVADREIEATQYAIADRQRHLIGDVRIKFGEVLTAVRELSVSDTLVATIAQQHALMTARVEEGATPPLERDAVRVELQRLEADRMLQAGHAEHALIELKRLLGSAPDASLTLREDLEQLVQREIAQPISNVAPSADRSDVEEVQARVNLAEARLDKAERDGRVDMSAFAMYMRSDAGFPQRGIGPQNELERVRGVFHYLAGGVMISMPILNRNQGEIAAAQAQRAGAAALLEATRLTAQAEVAAARTRDDHARRALGVYSAETRALARQNFDTLREMYDLGRLTMFEVLTEQRRYLDTERAYTNVLREAYEARQALKRALGEVQ